MSLLSLSNELLNAIARNLVPTMETDLGSYGPDPDFGCCRLALLALAKTNRRLNAIAIPHLYHTVCIEDLRAVFDLLGTLIVHDDLAGLVRVLNVTASLDDNLDDYTDEKSQAIFAAMTVDMRAHRYLARCFGDSFTGEARELTWSKCDDYPESACALLLCLASKLEALYIHMPNWNVSDYDVLIRFFKEDGTFPQHLSLLSLTADPNADDPCLPQETPECFMGPTGNIKHLELFGAYLLLYGNDDKPFPAAKWRNLETVDVQYAYTAGGWWYRLCEEARPPLKRIHISISPYFDGKGNGNQPGYNEAFALCADSLEYLRLDMGPSDYVTSHFGPTRRLSCLPSLRKLKHLELSVAPLFGGWRMGCADVCDYLSPSLESIRLYEDDYRYPEVRGVLYDSIKTAWKQLVLHSEQKLPFLRRVHILMGLHEDVVERFEKEFDEEPDGPKLKSLCTMSVTGSRVEIECIPLQGA